MLLSEQEIVRREKLEQLRALGIEPYPAALYPVSALSQDLKQALEPQLQPGEQSQDPQYQEVCMAGRLMSFRIQGKASFAELQDAQGRIQIYVNRDEICPGEDKELYNTVFKKLLDLGDFIGVRGFMFKTQMGELTLHVRELHLLSKSLRPLPLPRTDKDGNVYDAFTDPELRYRQRYADLVVNPQVKEVFLKRTKIMQAMRRFFDERGYLEVDTPVLQPIPGGASARPFITHHNTLDMPLYLRIANELYLKRLIVGGLDAVYEFSRNFRNEGMDRTHNPEFTVMELYVAYKDYRWMMELTEELLETVALAVHGTTEVQLGDKVINYQRPYRRVSMYDAIKEYTGIDISQMDETQLRQTCQQLQIEVDDTMGKGKLIDAIFGEKCEPHFIQPTFIIDYPIEMSPLCKRHRDNPDLTERFELMVNGKELANAYTELNDPIDQRARFEEQLKLQDRGDDEAMFIDQDFLRALEYGMPPTSGIGIGIDRLTMFMTNQASIQEVLFFPQMRPEKFASVAKVEDYVAVGVREELVPILQKLKLLTIEELRKQDPNKLHQEVCGMRKKLKLNDVQNPSKEEVAAWLQA
ncbi:lysine--tRNA ligase [Eisenibacter elegans]|jgi:lysyl-tRNA synthetase class 2|uniref:lysine--tRNA ligase n=1 Tax=Eisenibacter elegans TaxID=997 RepID=UPI0003FECD8E|nr:lysine--tRNA ligase [Eisenibacter elegans]